MPNFVMRASASIEAVQLKGDLMEIPAAVQEFFEKHDMLGRYDFYRGQSIWLKANRNVPQFAAYPDDWFVWIHDACYVMPDERFKAVFSEAS